jgi:hypothetical protein
MRRLTILVALAVTLAVSATAVAKPPSKPPTKSPSVSKPAAAKPPAPTAPKAGGGGPKHTSVKPSAPKVSTVKVKSPVGPASAGKPAKAPKSAGSAPKANGSAAKAGNGKSTQTTKASNAKSGKPAKADATTASASTSRKTSATSSPTGSGTTGTIDFTSSGLAQKLQKNSALRSKIEAKLLAAGYTGTVYEALYGFKNLGQLNAATNQVQNQGYSFQLLKVLMTGTYVDPQTHVVYRANRLPDGTVQLTNSNQLTNPVSVLSLGQAKQSIAGGATMPVIVTTATPTTSTSK